VILNQNNTKKSIKTISQNYLVMKKLLLFICIISISIASAQKIKGITGDTNWLNNWTNFKPIATVYKESNEILYGKIDGNKTLYKKNTYLLSGVVYLTDNAILTIEPGTVIRGDFETCGTLVVTKGATIIAEGEETDPIIFTSNKDVSDRKSGDWGGIILLGDAPINKFGGVGFLDFNLDPKLSMYGGKNEQSNSGKLKYVRIEFSGRKLNALKELNGLSLAGVGNKTKIDFVQISYSNDDSFECYGGDVTLSNLVSFKATDDDFDFTQGAQCVMNNSIAIRYPYFSDASRSRCFEIDSYDKVENADLTKKLTRIVATNITLVNNENNSEGLIREAIYIKENSFFTLKNSLISGFSPSVLMSEGVNTSPESLKKIEFEGVLLNNCNGSFISEVVDRNKAIENWYSNTIFSIEYDKLNNLEMFTDSSLKKTPDFRIKENRTVTQN
jgi:hypothetical protein